ncbi:hypothetical protein SAMN04488498_1048 [Mesorhizobium albiziae]|uniref:Alpha/beta hydrolase family protein n=1 Tax=Neomesorhizobium albiziae TaxID=335020 RepID=A0A1I3XXU0_9HYPH|nr:alpha/beta hydrolase [Mesorhizobium albiziae]GLS30283.1 hypothetical protein GCM10007937_19910 [Mesorhizobium albiziae]SFK23881.1 hypothetical protein SAMN04488498_1048 [Mesorhizobium albiziae]
MRCDRAIAKGFRAAWFTSLNLWQYWEAIEVPILILHGAKSDLLTYDLCNDMIERNPNATLHRFHDCGHVPPLMTTDQVDVVTNFLTRDMNPGKEAG